MLFDCNGSYRQWPDCCCHLLIVTILFGSNRIDCIHMFNWFARLSCGFDLLSDDEIPAYFSYAVTFLTCTTSIMKTEVIISQNRRKTNTRFHVFFTFFFYNKHSHQLIFYFCKSYLVETSTLSAQFVFVEKSLTKWMIRFLKRIFEHSDIKNYVIEIRCFFSRSL